MSDIRGFLPTAARNTERSHLRKTCSLSPKMLRWLEMLATNRTKKGGEERGGGETGEAADQVGPRPLSGPDLLPDYP